MTSPLDALLADVVVDSADLSLARSAQLNLLQPVVITVTGDVSCMGTFVSDGVAGAASGNVPFISLVGRLGVGARVLALSVPSGGNYIIGPARSGNQETVSVNMAAGASNSGGGYTDITGVAFNFTKKFADTALKATLIGSSFASVTGANIDAGVRVDGVDYLVAEFFYNQGGVHLSWGGISDDVALALPAATYTVQARWNNTGAGTVTMDSSDRVSLSVEEVPPPAP